MDEKYLQQKLIELIQDEQFLESIINTDRLDDALQIDNDPNTIPEFSIDHLLKRKYSKSAKSVINSLNSYEIISGDEIKNISLDKNERLFPDCLLFNRETNEIIVIENKVSSQTEREALTELLGYSQEIRNCLPFISDFDICYILISTEFNTLIDHSVSSQIINSEIKILCLRPIVKDSSLKFDIHFPSSWSNIGQNGLPNGSFTSYTMCLKKNCDETGLGNIIQQAVDLISFEAISNRTSGFCIIWENSLNEMDIDFEYGISIYVLNSFVFLPNAFELGFNLNPNSILAQFILNKVDAEGINQIPNSLFSIAERSQKLLEKYFKVTWDRLSTWDRDIKDELYKIQRFPIHTESWGAIGEFIKYYYYHPAISNNFLLGTDIIKSNPNDPLITLQIINLITGNTLFKYGHFYLKDIYDFGTQLYFYGYSCKNALETDEEKLISNEALLFWNILPLMNSLNEIRMRVIDSENISSDNVPKLKVYLRKKSVNDEYRIFLQKFIEWFENEFLKGHNLHKNLFKIGYSYAPYFNYYTSSGISSIQTKEISDQVNEFFRNTLSSMIISHNNMDHVLTKEAILLINSLIDNDLEKIDEKEVLELINRINFDRCIINQILDILDFTFGEVFHRLKDVKLSNSVDLNWLKDNAQKRFQTGNKYTALEIASNGAVGLVDLAERYRLMGELTSPEEIFLILNPASSIPMVLKKKWVEIMNGDI